MNAKLKIVTQIPLRGLWSETGSIRASRLRNLSSLDIRDLLLEGEVQFVVVDVGLKPRWIAVGDCYSFWMDEVQHRLAEPDAQLTSSQMPGIYSYRASEWHSDEITVPVVVLELYH
ncbi:MAG: hypothetical protein ACXVZV_10345 [Terriglobales bacterium]